MNNIDLEQLFAFNFLDNMSHLSIPDILMALVISLTIGLFTLFVYTRTFKGVMYSSSFAFSLIGMNLVTTLILMAVTSHFLVGFGLIGALSIVRFRTVVKEPLDLVYLFWAIAIGIIVGSGFIVLAATGSVVIGGVLFIFSYTKTIDIPYIVVISCDSEAAEKKAHTIISEQTKKHIIKAKTVSKESIELTIEVRLKQSSSQFINMLSHVNGVRNSTLVSYNGDYYM